MLRNGASPNVSTDYGYTALHLTALHDNYQIAELLLKYEADPTIKSLRECLTTKELAMKHKSWNVVKTIEENGY